MDDFGLSHTSFKDTYVRDLHTQMTRLCVLCASFITTALCLLGFLAQ
jgi:hypothetical protein